MPKPQAANISHSALNHPSLPEIVLPKCAHAMAETAESSRGQRSSQ